jgi:SAM-dependent methyltransferase
LAIEEVGCGEGVAAITIAKAYPNAEIDGYDLDEASIGSARTRASSAGVADRVRFVRDAADPMDGGDYDLVMAIEMLHDMPDPVGILRTMQKLAGENGVLLVVDERTEDSFTVPTSEMERLFTRSAPCTASPSACRTRVSALAPSSAPIPCAAMRPKPAFHKSRPSRSITPQFPSTACLAGRAVREQSRNPTPRAHWALAVAVPPPERA